VKKEEKLQELFGRFMKSEISEEELQLLLDHFEWDEHSVFLRKLIADELEREVSVDAEDSKRFETIDKQVKAALRSEILPNRPLYRRLRMPSLRIVASIALIVASAVAYLFFNQSNLVRKSPLAMQKDLGILPGGNHAFLEMADGTIVNLDSLAQGRELINNLQIIQKTGDGQITFMDKVKDEAGNPEKLLYHTVSTPKGGQFHVVLPDGTNVWLNAASSIRFPAVFDGNTRTVYVDGEAYFEVQRNREMPYTVITDGQEINVLGTNFNVNAYKNEPFVRTSLFSGKIQITKEHEQVLISPGQETLVGRDQVGVRVEAIADTALVLAWRNNMFQFYEADIQDVMRQMERWYDVEVVFEGAIPHEHFTGKIPRDANGETAMQILRLSGINFTIEGRKIIVKEEE